LHAEYVGVERRTRAGIVGLEVGHHSAHGHAPHDDTPARRRAHRARRAARRRSPPTAAFGRARPPPALPGGRGTWTPRRGPTPDARTGASPPPGSSVA